MTETRPSDADNDGGYGRVHGHHAERAGVDGREARRLRLQLALGQ